MTFQKIQNLFNKYGISYTEMEQPNDETFIITITKGDYKHAHQYADEIMLQCGYKLHKIIPFNVEESEGEDWYSAIRYYKFDINNLS